VVEPPFLPSKNYYPTVISHGNKKKKTISRPLPHSKPLCFEDFLAMLQCSITEGHHLSQLGSSCTNPRCKDSGNLSWECQPLPVFLVAKDVSQDGDISVQ